MMKMMFLRMINAIWANPTYELCVAVDFDHGVFEELTTDEKRRYLLKCADLNVPDANGWYPIHYLTRYWSDELVEFVVALGVDLECETPDGWRPIHFICRYGTPALITKMLKVCDVTRKCKCVEVVDCSVYDLMRANPAFEMEEV